MKKIVYRISVFSLFLLFIASCSNSKSEQKSSENNMPNGDKISSNTTELMACNHTTKIYWKGTKPTGEHHGYLKISDGEFFTEGENLLGGAFNIDMTSIVDLDLENVEMNTKLVNHLKSQDFFAVDSFPSAKFEITKVEKLAKEMKKDDLQDFTHYITGDLTIKGITNSVEFPAKVWFVNDNIYANSNEFTIDRTLWNVNYQSKKVFEQLKDKFIHDEITLKIESKSMKAMN